MSRAECLRTILTSADVSLCLLEKQLSIPFPPRSRKPQRVAAHITGISRRSSSALTLSKILRAGAGGGAGRGWGVAGAWAGVEAGFGSGAWMTPSIPEALELFQLVYF